MKVSAVCVSVTVSVSLSGLALALLFQKRERPSLSTNDRAVQYRMPLVITLLDKKCNYRTAAVSALRYSRIGSILYIYAWQHSLSSIFYGIAVCCRVCRLKSAHIMSSARGFTQGRC